MATNYHGTSAQLAQWQNVNLNPNSVYYLPPQPTSQKAQPMNPIEEYISGDLVTVRTGKKVYRVIDAKYYPDENDNIYTLKDELDGRTNRAWGKDLKRVVSLPPAPKVIVHFDSVIIADEKRQQILEALEQINQSDLIFKVWGFGETMEKGKGVAMLFYGLPGTGKTLMAQAIAHKLDYKLSIISTADVESSAPGEAERNIRKHFKDAKGGKTILLFDECDSLIFSRQYVGAIMGAQINELLSQIERFDGITLFTTNRLGTLDEAMNRRIALKLEFSMPSPSQRVEIWRRMFPKAAPLSDDIDWLKLAGIELSGGYIKNCVLRAARMAATEKVHNSKKQIRMAHLVKAVELETTSMIEFEEARAEHASGYGHVSAGHVRGRGTIERTTS